MCEKIIYKVFIFCWFATAFFLIAWTVSGCTSRPVVIATDESIIAGQVSTARIEAINGEINRILQQYDSIIGGAQLSAIRGIDDALEALDRYDEFVQQCIRSLREIELATRTGENEE